MGDTKHLEKYGLAPAASALTVERLLPLPGYRTQYNQGSTNGCVGYSSSWAMSILNREMYDPKWLWDQAKLIDQWTDTNPGDNNGTSVRAGMDVLRTQGHRQVWRGADKPVDPDDGILRNEWASGPGAVDQVRQCIADGMPVVLGIEWMESFFTPTQTGHEYWIGKDMLAGKIAGGHAICVYGASDKRQAIKLVNSWGTGYPLVWLGYDMLQKLIDGFESPGEATTITDKPAR
ncbi:MAG: hypothetical protein ACR2M1_12435 [Gemmatimonadaceae bacterium]